MKAFAMTYDEAFQIVLAKVAETARGDTATEGEADESDRTVQAAACLVWRALDDLHTIAVQMERLAKH
jgi:hypothetical protein